jgi:uncharacterized metal-binding protein YceD (DUF177 family)
MGNPLRVRRPLAELAAKGQVFEIADKISGFTRLAGIVETDLATLDPDKIPGGWRDSLVTGRLAFGFADAQMQVATIEGEVAVTIDAVCQRCLEPFRYALSSELRLLPTTAGQGVTAGTDFELWELDDASICPAEVIEEVLIMAMPLSVMHDDAEACGGYEPADEQVEQTTKPFAELRAQLDQDK